MLVQIVPEWKHWITFDDREKDLQILSGYPNVCATFLKCNTSLPSSAPVERLFSTGGLILAPRRNKLSDDVFEQLLMLKTNADIWSETLMTIMTWIFPRLELLKDMLICLLWLKHFNIISFLADRTYGRAIATVLRPSSSVTLYIVAKRCVLEQKLLLRAYRKSYVRNRLVPKWMTLTFV